MAGLDLATGNPAENKTFLKLSSEGQVKKIVNKKERRLGLTDCIVTTFQTLLEVLEDNGKLFGSPLNFPKTLILGQRKRER